MKMRWSSHATIWLLRRLQRRENTILLADFAWTSPKHSRNPRLWLRVRLARGGALIAAVHLTPESARTLCQSGLEVLDRQLEEYQSFWREEERDGDCD